MPELWTTIPAIFLGSLGINQIYENRGQIPGLPIEQLIWWNLFFIGIIGVLYLFFYYRRDIDGNNNWG